MAAEIVSLAADLREFLACFGAEGEDCLGEIETAAGRLREEFATFVLVATGDELPGKSLRHELNNHIQSLIGHTTLLLMETTEGEPARSRLMRLGDAARAFSRLMMEGMIAG